MRSIEDEDIHVVTVGEQGPPGPPGPDGGGSGIASEPVSVWNNGDPQIVFTKDGDVVSNVT